MKDERDHVLSNAEAYFDQGSKLCMKFQKGIVETCQEMEKAELPPRIIITIVQLALAMSMAKMLLSLKITNNGEMNADLVQDILEKQNALVVDLYKNYLEELSP